MNEAASKQRAERYLGSMNSDTEIEILELRPEEMQLIKSLRNNWRFGEVVIMVRDGIPYRLRRVTEFIDLKN